MKFSIRELLLVTLVVAVALGWWLDHRHQVMRLEPLAKAEKLADDRFRALREIVEGDGSKVMWEQHEDELKMGIAFGPAWTARLAKSLPPSSPTPSGVQVSYPARMSAAYASALDFLLAAVIVVLTAAWWVDRRALARKVAQHGERLNILAIAYAERSLADSPAPSP